MAIEYLVQQAIKGGSDYVDYVTPEYKYRIEITHITKLTK